MNRGCLARLLFSVVLLVAFGGSTYFWFTFFVKGRSLPTPNLIGRSVADARRFTSDLGVELDVDEQRRRNSDKVPVGHIVWQNRTPGAASFIKRGSILRVELSAGPLVLRVPDLSNESAGTGMLRLGQQNLKLGSLTYVEADVRGILAADPPNGTVVGPQSGVSLLVAVPAAAPRFVMPDLIGRRLDLVRPALEARGLTVEQVKFEAYPGIPDGIVIRQYPLRGAPVSSRDPISVSVSRQEETSIIEEAAP
ncbi:MAG TPA: PASTA domain-containing protein [Thermoanaerobaculia bacterium]|jgi:serine/threonine-protein kinase|nr:PASTA domain-containing protein [Thermoanaerobaculia bacterium]